MREKRKKRRKNKQKNEKRKQMVKEAGLKSNIRNIDERKIIVTISISRFKVDELHHLRKFCEAKQKNTIKNYLVA